MQCDPNFLISGSLPKILPLDINYPLAKEAFELYKKSVHYLFSSPGENNMYAVTLTISPRELHWLKQSKKNQIIYLNTKLKELKISGVYIAEDTKKKVKHLHGIIVKSKEELFETSKLFDIWKSSCKVRRIYDHPSYTKWIEYCCKNCITPDIETWLNL